MKSCWAAVVGWAFLGASVCVGDSSAPSTPEERLSYSLGADFARHLKGQDQAVDIELLVRGLRDGFSGSPLLVPEAEIHMAVTRFQVDLRRQQVTAKRMAGWENKQAGDAFLAQNKTKEGVRSLANGLQYRILTAGRGQVPVDGDTVALRYRGAFIDGTEFDRSNPDGPPELFKLAEVIAGWREALKLMPVGSSWQLFVPPQLAYGSRSAAHNIGPNTTLVFDIELVAVQH